MLRTVDSRLDILKTHVPAPIYSICRHGSESILGSITSIPKYRMVLDLDLDFDLDLDLDPDLDFVLCPLK